jgi:hypothetical protein
MKDKAYFYIVPLNEIFYRDFVDLKKDYFAHIENSIQFNKMKSELVSELHKCDDENKTVKYLISITSKEDNSISEKEDIAEYHVFYKYGLIEKSKWYEKPCIDLSDKINEVIYNDGLGFVFPKPYTSNVNNVLLIRGVKNKFMIQGADVIRIGEIELRDIDEFNLFFDEYQSWPYMLVVDDLTFTRIEKHLDE